MIAGKLFYYTPYHHQYLHQYHRRHHRHCHHHHRTSHSHLTYYYHFVIHKEFLNLLWEGWMPFTQTQLWFISLTPSYPQQVKNFNILSLYTAHLTWCLCWQIFLNDLIFIGGFEERRGALRWRYYDSSSSNASWEGREEGELVNSWNERLSCILYGRYHKYIHKINSFMVFLSPILNVRFALTSFHTALQAQPPRYHILCV